MTPHPDGPRPAPLVWDLPLRLFHWLLVVLFAACWVTQELGSRWMSLHMWLGYCVGALLVFRLAWGFVGPRHARFADFLAGPRRVVRYVTGWLRGTSAAHTGHDPAGGWWVVLMLGLLAVQVATGMLNSDDALHAGPWHYAVPDDLARAAGALHGDIFDVLVATVCIHVTAVLAHLVRPGIDLVTPMFTGRKAWASSGIGDSRLVRAVLAIALGAGLIALLVVLAPPPDPADLGFY